MERQSQSKQRHLPNGGISGKAEVRRCFFYLFKRFAQGRLRSPLERRRKVHRHTRNDYLPEIIVSGLSYQIM